MKPRKDRTFTNVQDAVEFMMKRPDAYHMVVLHDDACSPARCTCKPDFVVEDMTADNWIAGQKAEDEWRKATSN